MRHTLAALVVCFGFLFSASAHAGSPVIDVPEIDGTIDVQTPEEIEAANNRVRALFKDAIHPSSLTEAERKAILSRYQHLDPKKEIPKELLDDAVLFFDANKAKFSNHDYLGVVDYRIASNLPRFFVVDLTSGNVEKYHTAHGMGSDPDDDMFAEKFSNIVNSRMSSIGFALTAEIYSGRFKRSMRIDGLSSTNSRIRERSVVVHGWDNAHEKNVKQGLSWGCPALDWTVKDRIIDHLQGAGLIYFGFSKKK
jgi:hypothetical protein